LELNN